MADYKMQFQKILGELFQFEAADLDFGIYRILNFKRTQITEFINEGIGKIVDQAFDKYGTYWFCAKFIDRRSRTVDQMVQAARSGRQNIAEGSRASATSSHTELRLLNVPRASFEELLLDYEDFLRHRRLAQWAPDSREASAIRQVPRKFKKNQTDQSDRTELTNLSDQERWALYAPWL